MRPGLRAILRRSLLLSATFGAAVVVGVGCVHRPLARDRGDVSAHVADRMGYELGAAPIDGATFLPAGISLEAGLAEDEAVLVALWNNAAFQELLADLGIARGDLVQAGLLPNPEIIYLFQMPEKPLRYAVDLPLEAFWLRPIRVAAAARESDRVSQRLTQAALDLIRDVRQAYADALVARGRLTVGEDALRVRGEISKAADARLKAGDISVQEAAAARIDVLQAQQDLIRIRQDVSLASARLRNLLGLRDAGATLKLNPARLIPAADPDLDALIDDATQQRPDVLAADQNIAAARERLRLSRLVWFRFLGIADATSGQKTGHELGPGFRMTVPLFNRNQGNIARAEAELEKAVRNRQTVVDQVVLDVRQAHVRFAQARSELDVVEGKVRPEVDGAIKRAESAYREGNAPYVIVLETTRQYLDTRLRQEQLRGEVRRAAADLERSVGRRIAATAAEEPKP